MPASMAAEQADSDRARDFEITALPAGFADDPYPTYRALLEHAPLKRFADGSIMLSRYEDLDRVYRDTRTFSSDKKVEFLPKFGPTPLYEHHTTSLVFNDPPLHTRVRKIMMGALTPRAIAAMEPGLIALVDGLLDRLAAKGDDRRKGLEFAQLARGVAVRAHYHLMAMGHLGPIEKPRRLQRRRIGPDRVVIVRRDGDRAVGDDRIQVLAAHRMVQHRVIPALRHQQRPAGVACREIVECPGQRRGPLDMAQLQMRQLGPAKDKMQMAFDKAGQQRAAVAIKDFGGASRQRFDFRPFAHRQYLRPRQGNRLAARSRRIHGQDAGIGQNQVGGHDGLFFGTVSSRAEWPARTKG